MKDCKKVLHGLRSSWRNSKILWMKSKACGNAYIQTRKRLCVRGKRAIKTKATRNKRLKDVMFSHNFSHSETIPTWQNLYMHFIWYKKQRKSTDSKQLMAWVSSNDLEGALIHKQIGKEKHNWIIKILFEIHRKVIRRSAVMSKFLWAMKIWKVAKTFSNRIIWNSCWN